MSMSRAVSERSKIKLTSRGWRTVVSLAALYSLGLLFTDLVLIFIAAFTGLVLLSSFAMMRGRLKRLSELVRLEPDSLEASLTAGEGYQGVIRIDSSVGLQMSLSSPLEEGVVEPSALGPSDSSFSFKFSPKLSGNYVSDELGLRLVDRLGLFSGESVLPLHLSFRVYPRVLAVAAEAARFLAGTGGVGYGDQPKQLKGSGLEYAESRLYEPGDYLRNLDWKATARLGRLVVKDYYVEGGSGAHIVYEAVAPDPVSLDELSASFLRIVLSSARMGLSQGITIHDGVKVLYHVVEIEPWLAVARALHYVLKGVDSGLQQLYEVLEPGTAIGLRELFSRLEKDSLSTRWLMGARAVDYDVHEPYRFLQDFVADEGRVSQLLFVSALCEPSKLLGLTRFGSERGKIIRVALPTKPWLWSGGLEDSYRTWKSQSRVSRLFSRSRVDSIHQLSTIS